MTTKELRTLVYVTVAWARRVSTCQWCELSIGAGEPVVRVVFVRLRWSRIAIYHLDTHGKCCWVEKAKDYLASHPHVPMHAGPGRPAIQITPEQRHARRNLIQRLYYWKQQKEHFISLGFLWRLPAIELHVEQLTQQMVKLGGGDTAPYKSQYHTSRIPNE